MKQELPDNETNTAELSSSSFPFSFSPSTNIQQARPTQLLFGSTLDINNNNNIKKKNQPTILKIESTIKQENEEDEFDFSSANNKNQNINKNSYQFYNYSHQQQQHLMHPLTISCSQGTSSIQSNITTPTTPNTPSTPSTPQTSLNDSIKTTAPISSYGSMTNTNIESNNANNNSNKSNSSNNFSCNMDQFITEMTIKGVIISIDTINLDKIIEEIMNHSSTNSPSSSSSSSSSSSFYSMTSGHGNVGSAGGLLTNLRAGNKDLKLSDYVHNNDLIHIQKHLTDGIQIFYLVLIKFSFLIFKFLSFQVYNKGENTSAIYRLKLSDKFAFLQTQSRLLNFDHQASLSLKNEETDEKDLLIYSTHSIIK
jgi:hypothetical protein